MTQAVLALSDANFYPAPLAVPAEGLQAGAGQRVPGRPGARQEPGLSGLRCC
jgi:hypothetical protein